MRLASLFHKDKAQLLRLAFNPQRKLPDSEPGILWNNAESGGVGTNFIQSDYSYVKASWPCFMSALASCNGHEI